MMTNKEKVKIAIEILKSITEAVRDLKRVPNGELYARLMSHISYEDYTNAINIIKRAGLVIEINNELIWNISDDCIK